MLALAEAWKRLGVDVEPNMIPAQRISDREYRAQFPAFEMISASYAALALVWPFR